MDKNEQMTSTTDIDLTKPSRRLDALVAERIFGETVEWYRKLPIIRRPEERGTKPVLIRDVASHYSFAIRPAWHVVEKMRQDGWTYTIHDAMGYHMAVFRRGTERRYHTAKSPAVAICGAALRILEHQA